jgi:hypothetical protein
MRQWLRESKFQANSGKKLLRLPQPIKLGTVVLICNLSYVGGLNRRTTVQASLANTWDPIPKLTWRVQKKHTILISHYIPDQRNLPSHWHFRYLKSIIVVYFNIHKNQEHSCLIVKFLVCMPSFPSTRSLQVKDCIFFSL